MSYPLTLFYFNYFGDSVLHFCLGWPQISILLPMVSHVAEITSLQHHLGPSSFVKQGNSFHLLE
jgi:hypothetical protein